MGTEILGWGVGGGGAGEGEGEGKVELYLTPPFHLQNQSWQRCGRFSFFINGGSKVTHDRVLNQNF